jgi:hypothetical protein
MGSTGFPVAGVALTYVTGPVPQLDAVQLDVAHGSVFLDAETQLINHRGIMRRTADVPDAIVTTTPSNLRAFIFRVKAGEFNQPHLGIERPDA